MNSALTKVVYKKAPLAIYSLILGYASWYILSAHTPCTITHQALVCFYNEIENSSINAPEYITITLYGNRTLIRAIQRTELALHIDAHTLHHGTQHLTVTADRLFLPESIKLVHYEPSPITITLETKQKDVYD